MSAKTDRMLRDRRITLKWDVHDRYEGSKFWSKLLRENIADAEQFEKWAVREACRPGAHGVTEWMITWGHLTLDRQRCIEISRKALQRDVEGLIEGLGIEGVKVEVAS